MTEKQDTEPKVQMDAQVLSRLLQVTRDRLVTAVLGTTELETLLAIEREKTAALEARLAALQDKDTTDNFQ
jgi:hypothetical protein